MKCPNCNTQNSSETIFCTTCGTKLGNIITRTGSVARFIFCTTCGTKLSNGDKFCQNCGNPVLENDNYEPEEVLTPVQTSINEPVVNDTQNDNLNFNSYKKLSSDGYCYFTMRFYDSDNNKDSELAEKIFEYCKNNFEWFTTDDDSCFDYGDYFVCENGTINASGENNGLTITPTEEFIEFINKKFSPEKMEVTNVQDYSCRYIGDNYVQFYIGTAGSLMKKVDSQFAGAIDFDFFIDDCSGYPYIQNSFKKIYPVFKNKNNGKLYNASVPIEVNVIDEEDDWIVELANGSPHVFTWNDSRGTYKESNIEGIFGINYFDPEDFYNSPNEILNGVSDDEEDWDNFELVAFKEENLDF